MKQKRKIKFKIPVGRIYAELAKEGIEKGWANNVLPWSSLSKERKNVYKRWVEKVLDYARL